MGELKTMKDVIKYQLTDADCPRYDSMHDSFVETLFINHLAYKDREKRINDLLSDWNEYSKQYWLHQLSKRIKEDRKDRDAARPSDLRTWYDNLSGVGFGDIFVLEYYGLTVLLGVCGTHFHKVIVYEIALKRIKQNGEDILIINYDKKNQYTRPAKDPLVVKGRNGWSVSNYWVMTTKNKDGEAELLIPVFKKSKLYKKALELGEKPETGYFVAYKFNKKEQNPYWTCWHAPKRTPRTKRQRPVAMS